MLDRRSFVTTTVIMLVLFFLFMFSGVAKEILNPYRVNLYAAEPDELTMERVRLGAVYELPELSEAPEELWRALEALPPGERYYAYAGGNEEIAAVTAQWCRYERSPLVRSGSCEALSFPEDRLPEMIVLDGASLKVSDIRLLTEWTQMGIHLVFCGVPEELLGREEWTALLGIHTWNTEPVELGQVVVLSGFLLGGDMFYAAPDQEDSAAGADADAEGGAAMEGETEDGEDPMRHFRIAQYMLGGGTKAYVVGVPKERETALEDGIPHYPAIVWRYSAGSADVFVVNGDYMENTTGLGFLTAFRYETRSYALYPVINAQGMSVINYPSFANENESKMQQIYTRGSNAVLRDVVWPGLVAVQYNTESKVTCLISPKMDYVLSGEPDPEAVNYFLKLFREQEMEAGLSLYQRSTRTLANKLKFDYEFLTSYMPDYKIQTAYIADLNPRTVLTMVEEVGFPDIHTYLRSYQGTGEIAELVGEYEIGLSAVNTGSSHSYEEDLLERSIESTLAYSLILEDMTDTIYPESEEDEWQNVYDNFASYTDTYYEPFDIFDEVALSEAGNRARKYLATQWTDARDGNVIALDSAYPDGWFLLRTHGERIREIKGASYKLIEDEAYLITLEDSHVEITLEQVFSAGYY